MERSASITEHSDSAEDSEVEMDGAHPEELDDIDHANGADASESFSDASSSSDGGNGFLDIEASVADSDEDDASQDIHVEESFPQFCRLPIELRHRVWAFFDTNMKAPARVLKFHLVHDGRSLRPQAGSTLEQQTSAARAVLGTHRESRQLAVKSYPDQAFVPNGPEVYPCNKDKDVFCFSGEWCSNLDRLDSDLSQLLDGVRHIAFEEEHIDHESRPQVLELLNSSALAAFPALETIYNCTSSRDYSSHEAEWCVLDSTQKFYVKSEEEDEIGRVREFGTMYCWPGTKGTNSAPFQTDLQRQFEGDAPRVLEGENGRKAYQLIEWTGEDDLKRYYRIKSAVHAGIDYPSSPDEESDPEEDEYESEGIDDATIDDESGSSESEDDLAVQQSSPSEHESSFGGFSPLDPDVQRSGNADGPDETGFSEVEVGSSPSDRKSASDSDQMQMQRTNKRRRVMSDTSDEESENGASEAARRKKRQNRVVVSDSEDEHLLSINENSRDSRRVKRTVPTDTESEDDGDVVQPSQRPSVRRARAEDESGSDSGSESVESESSEEESSEDGAARQLTLAERIGAFRAAVPAGEDESVSNNEYDEFNDEGEEDYNYGGHDEFQDDEEGDGFSDHNELTMDMAEEESDQYEEGW